tara:strand:- start:45531 stop:46787 length:1257 start_codon:yes stop_codon:yes gene_type:complete
MPSESAELLLTQRLLSSRPTSYDFWYALPSAAAISKACAMRIGVVTTSYPRFPGDPAGNFVAELSAWIASRGHAVEVVAAGDAAADDRCHEAPVHRVPAATGLFYDGGAPDALGGKGAALAAARFSARLTREVRKRARHWDGIVAHWLAPCALAAALAAPRLPLWAIAHGGDVHLLRKLHLSSLASRVLGRPAVHLNFVSKALQEAFALAAGPAGDKLVARSSVVPMGVDLQHFSVLAKTRSSASAAGAKPLLLFLGRLVPIKGVDLLLQAVAQAGEQPWDICIAGAGPGEQALKNQARELGLTVEWAGEVHGAKRDALLARATLVVIPSRPYQGRQEGMPRVALEALAAGAELLVSDSGGLGEIPESVCHRVPSENASALAAAITAIAGGARAAYRPGHWLEDRSWDAAGPRLLPGL